MKQYTIKQLADMAGVSVRALHHYDEIELLKPHKRSESNYRYYSHYELLRLQQILFYRELDYALDDIRSILEQVDFDFESSLHRHKKELKEKQSKIKIMLNTIDDTLYHLKHKTIMNDEQLYDGFESVDVGKKLTHEAESRWGEEVKKSHQHIKKMAPKKWKAV